MFNRLKIELSFIIVFKENKLNFDLLMTQDTEIRFICFVITAITFPLGINSNPKFIDFEC